MLRGELAPLPHLAELLPGEGYAKVSQGAAQCPEEQAQGPALRVNLCAQALPLRLGAGASSLFLFRCFGEVLRRAHIVGQPLPLLLQVRQAAQDRAELPLVVRRSVLFIPVEFGSLHPLPGEAANILPVCAGLFRPGWLQSFV